MDTQATTTLARDVRKRLLHMIYEAKASHIGSCLSTIDILAVLYKRILNISPKTAKDPNRDRFILSKGHAAAGVYALLAALGFLPEDWLSSYNVVGAKLLGHLTCDDVPGVEFSTGSLGHGLPVAGGMALCAKLDKKNYRTFVLLSDGECDEGSNWEAALFAGHHKLDNLIAIIDYNKIQSLGFVKDILDLEPFSDKWKAFGWEVQEIDGHDHTALFTHFSKLESNGKPKVFIAHTIKGKGISFMEDLLAWHYKSPTEVQLQQALGELDQ